ncbi:MAG: type VI secretion system membrane subunit TssM, partial [Chromatiales bacterium]|nr:type VI secretion system membrane subunit TssM [Chromatiales bacterium]
MRLLRFIASKLRGVFILIGLVAIALVIWFVLPAVTMGGSDPFASAYARGGIIISMFAMAAIYRLRSHLTTRRRNEQLATQITKESKKEAPDEVGKREVEEFKKKFEEAMTLLKKVKTKNGARGSYLYVLPWYIFIGPPGSGKTTALLNSSLHFPLMDSVGAAVKGVGGTRNCDWWFTDEAVLLDTAGRYTTQDNQTELDKAEWKGFLGLLKKFRKRKPINGVIVAFGVDELMRMSESELITNAKAIKQRLLELQESFNIRFPVYVMLTKFDILPGFNEYFDDLGREEREQVWGMTFPLDEGDTETDVVPQFLLEFRSLQERIQGRELDRLQMESDLDRRDLIYMFPRVVGLLQDNVSTFLQEIFKPTRYEVQPMLRGVYFTSGTQDGTTLDRVVSALTSKFGLRPEMSSRKNGKGKGYFLAHLFTKVIFKESGLAGVNIKNERRLFALHTAGYAAVTLVFALFAGAWATSYFGNKTLVQEVRAAVDDAEMAIEEIDNTDKAPYAPTPALTKVREIPTGYAAREASVSLWKTFGLYQGDKLGGEAETAYHRVLYKTLLPRLLVQMETALQEYRGNPEYLYETLRVYLMFSDPKRLQKDLAH